MDNEIPNPFQLMEDNNIQKHFNGKAKAKIKTQLNETFGLIRLFGNITDVYLTSMIDTAVELAGSDKENTEKEEEDRE